MKEIPIDGSEIELFNRIRVQLDPFFIKYDDEALNKYPADINEEEDDPLPWGEYANFCPIIYKVQNKIYI